MVLRVVSLEHRLTFYAAGELDECMEEMITFTCNICYVMIIFTIWRIRSEEVIER